MNRTLALIARATSAVILLFAITACGGGGGGGNSSGQSNQGSGLSVSPGSLNFSATRLASAPATQYITVSITAPDAVYVVAGFPTGTTPPSWLTLNIPVVGLTSTVSVAINTTSLSAGTYSATVRVGILRSDGSIIGYQDVPVTYVLAPTGTPQVSPSSLSFSLIQGGSAPSPTTLSLSGGGDSFAWSAAVIDGTGGSWLRVNGASNTSGASLPSNVSVGLVGVSTMSAGTYTAAIRVTGPTGSVNVPVTLQITLPTIAVSNGSAGFAAVIGQSSLPSAANINVTTNAASNLAYTTSVTYGAGANGWLDVNGSIAPGTLNIAPNTTNLSAGTHTASVTLTPVNGGSPATVSVSYVLTASQLTLSPTSLSFSATPTTQSADLTRNVTTGDTGAAVSWSVASSVSWLTTSINSGTSGNTISVSVDPAQLENLANGSHTATLSFTYSGPGVTNANRTLTVSLSMNLPRVRYVAPYVAHVGDTKEVILRGEGFSALSSASIEFGGNAASGVTIVNDTEIRATPPSLAAGRYLVAVANGNSVGINRSEAELVVVPVPTHTAGLISSSGTRRRLIYDAERKCVYAANPGANVIERFCDSGTTWSSSSVTATGVKDISLNPNGQEIIAISSNTLYRINANTFTVSSSKTAAEIGISLWAGYDELLSIVIANDGRALILAGYQWTSLYRYDLNRSANAETVSSYSYYNISGALGMGISLNRDRVVTGDSPAISTFYLRLYDATNGSITQSAANTAAATVVTLDRTGTRIGAWSYVLDDTMGILGYTSNWRMVISPTGTRAYNFNSYDQTLRTFDISGSSVSQIGTGTVLSTVPGPTGTYSENLMVVSDDGGTLFIDGPAGMVVLPAP